MWDSGEDVVEKGNYETKKVKKFDRYQDAFPNNRTSLKNHLAMIFKYERNVIKERRTVCKICIT